MAIGLAAVGAALMGIFGKPLTVPPEDEAEAEKLVDAITEEAT